MNVVRMVRVTRIESVLGAVLLLLALAEMLFSDEQPAPTPVLVLSAVVPPLSVAFSRSAPIAAAAAVIAVQVLASLQPAPSGTLGAGLAWLAVAFGLAAWSRQPWPWLVALVVASTMHDLRTVGSDGTDVFVDWVFVGFTVWIGRLVHRRTVQADSLATRLELAEADRTTRTREAVARERHVIARELHDIVAHAVSLMVVQASTARPAAQRVDHELAGVLETIELSGRQALTELRRLLGVLREEDEPDLHALPDLARLGALLERTREAGVEVHAAVAVPEGVPPGIALCAYRTVQEGLTNAMRYAEGSPVEVTVTGDPRSVLVRVQDHGGSPAAGQLGAGTGLVGLRERVLLCGGCMTSGPNGPGYLLEVTLPLTDGQPS